jgi:hypothetical protein
MSKVLKSMFLVHAVVAAVIGALLLLIPGQFLAWINWRPIEPIANRLFGAALLGLSWSSFRGWRASEWAQVVVLVEMEAIFCILASVAVARHLLAGQYPAIVWVVFVGFLVFAITWTALFVVGRRQGRASATP